MRPGANAKIYILIGVLAVILLPFLVPPLLPESEAPFPRFGENDFIEYWTSFQLASQGADFADPELVSQVERKLGWGETRPLMMWNPPWTLVILSPIMSSNFSNSAKAFLVANVCLLLLGIVLVFDAFQVEPRMYPLGLLFGFCSLPVFFTLLLGQLSILLCFAACGLFWAVERKSASLTGLFLLLLSVKIHVVYLLALPFLVLLERRFLLRSLLAAGCLFLASLLLTSACFPNAISSWMHRGRHRGNPLLVDVYQWRTTSIVTQVRDLADHFLSVPPQLFIFGIPAVVAFALLVSLWRSRSNRTWSETVPWIIPLSCMTSPFSWIFDNSVNCLTQAALFAVAFSSQTPATERRIILLSCILLQLILFLQVVFLASSYEYYWYFAPALGLLWISCRSRGRIAGQKKVSGQDSRSSSRQGRT